MRGKHQNRSRKIRIATLVMLLTACVGNVGWASGELEPCADSGHPIAYPCKSGEWVKTYLELADGSVEVVKYELINGEAVFEGDIILHIDDRGYARVAKELDRLYNESHNRQKSLTRAITSFTWPSKKVYYEIDGDLPAAGVTAVNNGISHWELKTSLDFVPRTSQSDYVLFTDCNVSLFGVCIDHAEGCSSNVGRQGGQQKIKLAESCWNDRNVRHEIGHAVGLWHEQSRSDRDDFITIYWNNIKSGKEDQFWTVFQQGADGVDVGAYDYSSVMHYWSTAFQKSPGLNTILKKDGGTIPVNYSLSSGDVAGVEYFYGSSSLLDFYEGTGGTQSLVCRLARGPMKIDITDVDCPNDEARSLRLRSVPAGFLLRVYDSPSCVTSDDWTEIQVKQSTGSSYLISSFESTFENSTVKVTHHHNNGLDGKVSCLWAAQCGNGVCEAIENSSNCTADCGPAPYCGDGSCNGSESCYSCAADCGTCPCNFNGVCDPGETELTCSDCCQGPICEE